MGLFDLQGQYFTTAYAFKAMGKMLDTPQRVSVEGADTLGLATLAGRSADGNTVQVLISNYAVPAGFKPHPMQMPPEALKAAAHNPTCPNYPNCKRPIHLPKGSQGVREHRWAA